MSKELHSFLETKMKPAYHEDSNSFDESVQEEYINPHGYIDKTYLLKKLKLHMSTASFRSTVMEVFGVADFNQIPVENEVTAEEFYKHYTFGKFPYVSSWIGFFYSLNSKVLTREKLFDYVINSDQPLNSIHFWTGGVRPIMQDDRKHEPSRLFS